MNLTSRDDVRDPESTSFDGSLRNEHLKVRFRSWKRAFVIFGVITGILFVVPISVFIILGTASPASVATSGTFPAHGPASSLGSTSSPPTTGASSPGTASSTGTASSSQTAQTIAVAGLIIGCISAIGTMLSGWGTLVTARAMARQGVASRAPAARAKSRKPRIRTM